MLKGCYFWRWLGFVSQPDIWSLFGHDLFLGPFYTCRMSISYNSFQVLTVYWLFDLSFQGQSRSVHHRVRRIWSWKNRQCQIRHEILCNRRRYFSNRDSNRETSPRLIPNHGSHRKCENDPKRQLVEIRQIYRDRFQHVVPDHRSQHEDILVGKVPCCISG